MENVSIITIILIAFLGSFGHCVGMCGGIVLAYSSTKINSSWSKSKQSFSHILYSFGRITTYTTLGFIFGSFGDVVTFSRTTSGILLIFAGFLMILAGLSLAGKIKFLTTLEYSISKTSLYQKSFKKLIGLNTFTSFYLLGILNGLLPCGFVYVFAITAASTRSAFWGAIVMFIFGLSTLPVMFSLGFFVGVLKHFALRKLFITLISILVIFFGTYIMHNGYKYMTHTSKEILQRY